MTPKFTSKEIGFLKAGSDQSIAGPPDRFYSDLVLCPSDQLTNFRQRLEQSRIPKDRLLCAVLKVSEKLSGEDLEQAKEVFEASFQALLDKTPGKTSLRGIWEALDQRSFILAFWDYTQKKKAERVLTSLKTKISSALETPILGGAALHPFKNFQVADIAGNALKAIDHAAFFGPDHLVYFDAVSLNISGDRLYQTGRYNKAIKEYEKGLFLEPKNVNLMNSLGVCHGVAGHLDQAMAEFEKAVSLAPKEFMVLHNIGLVHQIREDDARAVAYLKKAHAINGQLFEVELLLGRLLLKGKAYDQAREHLESALKLAPESGPALRSMGELHLANNDVARAGLEFNRAVKINPTDAAALSGYAKAMCDQGKNLKIALTFAKKSLSLEPDNLTFKSRLEEITRSLEQAEQNKEPGIKSA